jgi:ABC-type multidrug transport system ATPase subunit
MISNEFSKLEWSKINYTLNYNDKENKATKERKILSDVTGEIYSGQLLAVMGPTACGKTSLLNVLTGRIPYNSKTKLHGNMYLNGEMINSVSLNDNSAYIAQDDILFSYLTVRETLHLSALFNTSRITTTPDEINARVDQILRELALNKAAHTIVGSETRRGISGGEYKRVLIGKALMKNPKFLLLDEPTSGLDSFQALAVMEAMKTVAANGLLLLFSYSFFF